MFSLRLVILNAFSEIQDTPLLVTQAGEMKRGLMLSLMNRELDI